MDFIYYVVFFLSLSLFQWTPFGSPKVLKKSPQDQSLDGLTCVPARLICKLEAAQRGSSESVALWDFSLSSSSKLDGRGVPRPGSPEEAWESRDLAFGSPLVSGVSPALLNTRPFPPGCGRGDPGGAGWHAGRCGLARTGVRPGGAGNPTAKCGLPEASLARPGRWVRFLGAGPLKPALVAPAGTCRLGGPAGPRLPLALTRIPCSEGTCSSPGSPAPSPCPVLLVPTRAAMIPERPVTCLLYASLRIRPAAPERGSFSVRRLAWRSLGPHRRDQT